MKFVLLHTASNVPSHVLDEFWHDCRLEIQAIPKNSGICNGIVAVGFVVSCSRRRCRCRCVADDVDWGGLAGSFGTATLKSRIAHLEMDDAGSTHQQRPRGRALMPAVPTLAPSW